MWHKIEIFDVNGNQMYVQNVQFDTIKPIDQATEYHVRDVFYGTDPYNAPINLLYEEWFSLINFLAGIDHVALIINNVMNDQGFYVFDGFFTKINHKWLEFTLLRSGCIGTIGVIG